jgi:hypothetical protein
MIIANRPSFSWLLTFLLGACGVFHSSYAPAQSRANAFGIKGGVSFSGLGADGLDVDHETMRTTLHAGVFGRVEPTTSLGLQAELLFSGKGTTVVYDGLIDQRVSVKLSYLEAPVFVVIRFGKVLEFNGGVYAAYLLSSTVSTTGDLGQSDDALDRDHFQGADYGLLIGGGANVGPVCLGIRYAYGLADLAASNTTELLLGDARNSTLQLYLAIDLKKKK